MDQLLRLLAALATERPIRALVIVSLISLGAGWLAGGLEVSTSRTALMSEDDEHWKRYMAFSEEFGIPEDLVIVVKGKKADVVRATTDDIAQRLMLKTDHVRSVFHRIDLSAFSSRAPLYLTYDQVQLLQRLAAEPAIAQLRLAPSAAGRINAIVELMNRAPTLWTKGSMPSDFHTMSAILESLLAELSRFTLAEGPDLRPRIEFIDPEVLGDAIGDPMAGSGLDRTGYLSTDEGRTAVMFVRPLYHTDGLEVVRPFVETVRASCQQAVGSRSGVSFGLTGIPASEIDEHAAVERDTKVTSGVALLGVIIIFLLYFPSARLLLLALAPVLVGVVWTAAAARMVFGYLNLISSIFLVILIGMGIDFSIHIASRFIEARREGNTPVAAATESILRAGRGIMTGGLTSAGAFAAVGFSEFKGMAELGTVASIGLVLTMFSSLTVLPALLILAGPPVVKVRQGFPGLPTFVKTLIKVRFPALIILVILSVPMAWFTNQAAFDFSLLNLMPAESESAILMAEMVDKRELSANAAVAIAPDLDAARALEAEFRELPSVFRAVSAATFLPTNQESRLYNLAEVVERLHETKAKILQEGLQQVDVVAALEALTTQIERLQDLAFRRGDGKTVANLEAGIGSLYDVIDGLQGPRAEQVRARIDAYTATMLVILEEGISRLESTVTRGAMTADDLPKGVKERFVSNKGRYAVYAFPKESIWDRPALANFLDEARAVAPGLTGFPETFYENTEVMIRGFYEAAVYATIAVVLLLLLDLHRISYVFIAILPLGCGTLAMLGLMTLAGIKYNLGNIVALPLIIGVGIDNAVHLIHRHAQDRDVQLTFERTGGAVILSSLTTMIGFGSLVMATHRGLASLGQVLFIGVGSCLLAALLGLPACLSRVRPPQIHDKR